MKLAITNIWILLQFSSPLYAQIWTLEQCIDSAYSNNTRIAIAENNQTLSAIRHKEVKSNLLPKLSINGDYKYFVELPYQLLPLSVFGGPDGQFKEAQFGVPHNINANAMLQAPLYSSNLMGSIHKMETVQKLVELEVQKTYDEIYFEVSNLYRNTQLVKSQISFVDSTIHNTKQVAKNIALLASEKLANQSDVKKLELKISTLASYRATLEVQRQQLSNALQLLTGSDAPFDVEDDLLMINITKYEANGSLEVDLLQLQQEIVHIDLQSLKRSKYIPEFGFLASYGTQGYGYDQSPNRFLNFYPIGYAGIRFSYPLFNGTVTNKKIHQKNIELENLRLKEEFARDLQQVEISNAILKLENAYTHVEVSEQQVELAESIYRQEEKKYRQGLNSINDLLIAQNEWFQHQQNYLQRIAELLAADLEIKKATNSIPKN